MRDLEKFLDKACPNLPTDVRETKLRFHLTAALPVISFQLKILPKQTYDQTIAKARELLFIFQRAADPVSKVDVHSCGDHVPNPGDYHLDKLELAITQVSEQLATMGTYRPDTRASGRCFECGQLGHLAQNCRSVSARDIVCYQCRGRSFIAHQCADQGNDQGGVPNHQRQDPPPHLSDQKPQPQFVPSLSGLMNTTKAAYTQGQLNHHDVKFLLDSGASCSVVCKDYVSPNELEPISYGRRLTSVGLTTMKVRLP